MSEHGLIVFWTLPDTIAIMKDSSGQVLEGDVFLSYIEGLSEIILE